MAGFSVETPKKHSGAAFNPILMGDPTPFPSSHTYSAAVSYGNAADEPGFGGITVDSEGMLDPEPTINHGPTPTLVTQLPKAAMTPYLTPESQAWISI